MDDSPLPDPGESVLFEIDAGALPDHVEAGTPAAAKVLISNDALPDVTVGFKRLTHTVGERGSLRIELELDQNPQRTVTIPVVVDADPDNPSTADENDYTLDPPRATFRPGRTTASITFRALRDDVDDDNEFVHLTFGDLPQGVSAAEDENRTSVTISGTYRAPTSPRATTPTPTDTGNDGGDDTGGGGSGGGGGGGGGAFIFAAPQQAAALPNPVISPRSLRFTAHPGRDNPAPRTLQLWSPTSGLMTFSLATNASWLSVTPASGSAAGSGNRLSISVSVDASGLGPGSHRAQLSVDGTGFRNPPRVVHVTLAVSTQAFADSLAPQYDANNNLAVDLGEALAALRDYFARRIGFEEILKIVRLYFAGG